MEYYPYADHLRVGLEHSLSSSNIDIVVDGFSGDEVVDGDYLDRIRSFQEEKFDWIIIMGGTNDIGWGKKPEVIYEGLSEYFLAFSCPILQAQSRAVNEAFDLLQVSLVTREHDK